jgi:hypothetical protein
MDQREGCYEIMKLCLLDLAHVCNKKKPIFETYTWLEFIHHEKKQNT